MPGVCTTNRNLALYENLIIHTSVDEYVPGRANGRAGLGVITAHDARTGEELWRRRTNSRPRRAGDETWGGAPRPGLPTRRHVDGPEPRPHAEPALHRHVGGLASAEVHGGRRRLDPPPQLDLRARRDTGEIVWY